VKAIETKYKGCRFRSRLEARWAVFFDALGVAWEYEPEGFELDGGARYLPDFWLPFRQDGWGYWVEVKPYAPTDTERRKLRTLAVASGHHSYLLCGTPSLTVGVLRSNYNGRDCVSTLPGFASLFGDVNKMHEAIAAARSARFEFGESGARA
jgi:hypothetical protein